MQKLLLVCVVALVLVQLAVGVPVLSEAFKHFRNHFFRSDRADSYQFQTLQEVPHFENVTRSPVILIPGLSGSRLQGQVDWNGKPPHWWCDEKFSWTTLWMSEKEFYPWVIDCLEANLKLELETLSEGNTPSYIVKSPDGVDIRADFTYDAVVHLMPEKPSAVQYLNMTMWLQESMGYTVGTDLFAYPFDFRYGPESYARHDDQYERLKSFVENVTSTCGRPPIIISISMGGPYIQNFLNTYVSTEWKQKFVGAFIPMSGPWAGSTLAMPYTFMDDAWAIPKFDAEPFARLVRSFPAVYYMFPDEKFWDNSGRVFVKAGDLSYTANNFSVLLSDAGHADLVPLYEWVRAHVGPSEGDPGVPTYCFYGSNVVTNRTFVFESSDLQNAKNVKNVKIEPGNGDGTVEIESLKVCESWKSTVQTIVIPNVDHTGFLFDETALTAIMMTVYEINKANALP